MDNPEKLATQGTQDEGAIKDGQSRETANIGYTRRRSNQRWTIQRNCQHRVHKTKKNKNTTQYVLVRRKLIIKQQEPHLKPGVNGSKQFDTFFLLKVILKTHRAYLCLYSDVFSVYFQEMCSELHLYNKDTFESKLQLYTL